MSPPLFIGSIQLSFCNILTATMASRSIEEADAMMRKMKATGVFKEVSIVKDEVNIPL